MLLQRIPPAGPLFVSLMSSCGRLAQTHESVADIRKRIDLSWRSTVVLLPLGGANCRPGGLDLRLVGIQKVLLEVIALHSAFSH